MNIPELIGEEWAHMLPKAEELLAPIREQLREERAVGTTVLPESNKIFRIFKEVPPSKIRVIFLAQDPYSNPIGMATGRAFECGKHPTASWRKIVQIYKDEVPDPNPQVIAGNLDHWVHQGVFLINKALTVRHKMPNSHTRFWEPFTRYAIGVALTDLNPKAVILLGSEAQRMIPRVHSPHKGFYAEHPAAASYADRRWDAKGLFTGVTEFLNFHDINFKF